MRNIRGLTSRLAKVIVGTGLLAGAAVAANPNQLLILHAEVDSLNDTIHIVGENFIKNSKDIPTVTLDGSELLVLGFTQTNITAEMPFGLAPGSYLLTVSNGSGTVKNDAFSVALGALGPEGPQGDPGPQGDTGPQGVPGLPGTPGEDGLDGTPGTDGSKWLTGESTPDDGLGSNGDFYLQQGDMGVGDVYERIAGAWQHTGNIRGAQGMAGNPGVDGAQGAEGATGPQGPAGSQGPQGLPGNLQLALMSCPPGSFVTGFDASGNLVCSGAPPPPPPSVCGNGIPEMGEQCDDGNNVSGDGCSATCVREDVNVDADGDGWAPADGDCCDDPTVCPNPAFVNPGAFEILNNSLDDDCDAATPDDASVVSCSTQSVFTDVTAMSLVQAMDLCQETTEAAPLSDRKWGVIGADLLLSNGDTPDATGMSNLTDLQTAVLTDYGATGPTSGATMSGLSSGVMRDTGDPGFVPPNPGTDFSSASTPPTGWLAANGGNIPGLPGCPPGTGANDSANLNVRIRVPTNAASLSYQFRFFSAEYGPGPCSEYNDFHVAILNSSAPSGIPADMNIARYDDGSGTIWPIGSQFAGANLFQYCLSQGGVPPCTGITDLVGTGMDSLFPGTAHSVGAASPWLTATAPVVPGEIIELSMMIFDVSDGNTDSLVLLDGFEWVPAPTSP